MVREEETKVDAKWDAFKAFVMIIDTFCRSALRSGHSCLHAGPMIGTECTRTVTHTENEIVP